MLHVGLDLCVGELATNQTLGIEDCVGWVHGDLVLGGITDQTLGVGEGNERRRGAVALVVGDDLNAIISVDTYTRVGGTQIDTDSRHLDLIIIYLCVERGVGEFVMLQLN